MNACSIPFFISSKHQDLQNPKKPSVLMKNECLQHSVFYFLKFTKTLLLTLSEIKNDSVNRIIFR
jgi:hypothetical protein